MQFVCNLQPPFPGCGGTFEKPGVFFISVFTEKYCTANHVDKLPGPRDWVQILQDQIKLARRRLKRGSGMYKNIKKNHVSVKLKSESLFLVTVTVVHGHSIKI